MFLVGYGVDMLRLVSGEKLILGGVEIQLDRGLEGPDDGDVLTRAVIDAFVGACPYCQPEPKSLEEEGKMETSSISLLERYVRLASSNQLDIINVDATILLDRPRLAKYIDRIRWNIAEVLGINPKLVSIKERCLEGLGPSGRGEGIEARVVMLVDRKNE